MNQIEGQMAMEMLALPEQKDVWGLDGLRSASERNFHTMQDFGGCFRMSQNADASKKGMTCGNCANGGNPVCRKIYGTAVFIMVACFVCLFTPIFGGYGSIVLGFLDLVSALVCERMLNDCWRAK